MPRAVSPPEASGKGDVRSVFETPPRCRAPPLRGMLYKQHSSSPLGFSGALGTRYFEADDALSVLYCFKSSECMHRCIPQYCYAFGDMHVVPHGVNQDGRLSGRVDSGRHKRMDLRAFDVQMGEGASGEEVRRKPPSPSLGPCSCTCFGTSSRLAWCASASRSCGAWASLFWRRHVFR